MNATVKIHLLGRDYMLRSQGDPAQIQAAAALVEEKLAGLSDAVSVDTRDRFMLAMLNLAGEYLQATEKSKALADELQSLTKRQAADSEQFERAGNRLIERIEAALDY